MTQPEPQQPEQPDLPSSEDFDAFQPALQRHLGLKLRGDLCAVGTIVMEGPVNAENIGPAGSYQGGAMATLIDTAGAICASAHGKSRMVATQDMTISYLAPARVGPVRATATLLRAGKAAIVVEVRCTDEGKDSRLCAVALVTCVSIGDVPEHVTAPERAIY